MKKLFSITLTIAVFCMLSSTAFAAPTTQQPQDELWQYIQSSNSFWDNIMKQIGVDSSQNTTKPGTTTKPGATTTPGTTTKPGTGSNSGGTTTPGTGTNPGTSTNPGTGTDNSYVNQVLQLVNQERASRGLQPLTLDAKASAAAQVRATECARSFSHTRPDGRSCFTALKDGGVSYRRAGENIAYGQRTPSAVMTDWMNSSGHRANILNSNYTSIGIGYTVINGTPYWAQFFVQK